MDYVTHKRTYMTAMNTVALLNQFTLYCSNWIMNFLPVLFVTKQAMWV